MTEPAPRTTEEQQLSDLLHRTVPEPHRGIDLDRIRPHARRHRGQGWLPAVAAACILLLVAVLGVLAVRNRHTGHPAAGSNPSVPVSASSDPSTPSKPLPWAAKSLATTDGPARLVALGDRLYRENGEGFSRLDPNTGAVLAMTTNTIAWPPVLAGGKLWVVVPSQSAYEIDEFDPTNLRYLGGLSGSASGLAAGQPSVLAASSDGSQIAFSAGNVVYLDAVTEDGRSGEQTVAGPITALGFSFDGTKLFVAHGTQVATIGATNQLQLLADRTLPSGNHVIGLTSSARGLWIATAAGIGAELSYAPAGDLTRLVPVTSAGGGIEPVVAATENTVFLAGTAELACADPSNGAIRASIALEKGSFLTSLAPINGRLVVGYQTSTESGIAYLTPPSACGF